MFNITNVGGVDTLLIADKGDIILQTFQSNCILIVRQSSVLNFYRKMFLTVIARSGSTWHSQPFYFTIVG